MNDNYYPAKSNVFLNNVAIRFKSFEKKIKSFAKKSNINFDEDIFMDTLLKCSETFSTENPTDNDIELYFWKAYKQNMFTDFNKNKFCEYIEIENIEDNFIDDVYNTDLDEILIIIKKEVEKVFGEDVYRAWILHICGDYTYEELKEEGYNTTYLHNEFKRIKRYILDKYVNKNITLKNLLKENNLFKKY